LNRIESETESKQEPCSLSSPFLHRLEDGRKRPDALRGLWGEAGFPSENALT
jgi:hypothetical protein